MTHKKKVSPSPSPSPSTYKKLTSTLDKTVVLAIVPIVLTIVFGIWGIKLTNKSNSLNQQMLDLSNSQVILSKKQIEIANSQIQLSKSQNETSLDLKHFIKLLDKTDTLMNISDSELLLTRQEQKIANQSFKTLSISNEAKFYLATQNLQLLLWQPFSRPNPLSEWDSTQKFTFLDQVDIILRSQLDNSYLLSNRYMFQEWLSVRDSIWYYTFDNNFYPKKETDNFSYNSNDGFKKSQERLMQEWRNCFIAIANLEQNTNSYMQYYRFFRTDPMNRGKKPSEETYNWIFKLRQEKPKIITNSDAH